MLVEYVLLLTLLTTFVVSLFSIGDGAFQKTFKGSAPRLGYRVEKLIRTGEGFGEVSENQPWKIK